VEEVCPRRCDGKAQPRAPTPSRLRLCITSTNPMEWRRRRPAHDRHAGSRIRRRNDASICQRPPGRPQFTHRRLDCERPSTTQHGSRPWSGRSNPGPRAIRPARPSVDSGLGEGAAPREFDVASPVKSARLYATALGAYEFSSTASASGDDVLAPGWTDYREHVKYQTYDVTAWSRPEKCDRSAACAGLV
jgi:hypothetical protein